MKVCLFLRVCTYFSAKTETEEKFLEQHADNEEEQNELLNHIAEGVGVLSTLAQDINHTLKVQAGILNDVRSARQCRQPLTCNSWTMLCAT